MRIQLIAIGQKMPAWVNTGVQEYAKRLPREWAFQLQEVAAVKRGKGADVARLTEQEGRRQLDVVAAHARVIALDECGQSWSTRQLAEQLEDWQQQASSVALLIGGADGLAEACLQKAQQRWSLSALTLPHAMVRVVVVEQLYRAWSINARHPYHRS